MTKQLQRAFDRASQLAPEEQDAIADWLLKEIDSDQRWQELFDKSPDKLSKLAQEALSEDDADLTKPLDL